MQSIQSVERRKLGQNGYESITGQINIEMKKPQLDPSLSANLMPTTKENSKETSTATYISERNGAPAS